MIGLLTVGLVAHEKRLTQPKIMPGAIVTWHGGSPTCTL